VDIQENFLQREVFKKKNAGSIFNPAFGKMKSG